MTQESAADGGFGAGVLLVPDEAFDAVAAGEAFNDSFAVLEGAAREV